ncbi:MAG: hypothetical protein KY459_08805 [Acidobacteria bacterium]|nr:hypothetical protein [Acidobacteriota bacterium]
MSQIGIVFVACLAVVVAIGLAWLPARLLLFAIGKSAANRVRQWVKRRKDRRTVPRGTPDRRQLGSTPAGPSGPSDPSDPSDKSD